MEIQAGFWGNLYIGSVRQKLEDIRKSSPRTFDSEKDCILEYYTIYEGLPKILGDKWDAFCSWYCNAPSAETISRARRLIKEEVSDKEKAQ